MREQLSPVDVAWLAGIYEGEGTCYVQQDRRGPNASISTSVRVCICMTDRDVVERIQQLFPSRTGIHQRKRGEACKRIYEWRLSTRRDVSQFLRLVLPLLGERRTAQALKVLAYAEDPNGGLGSGHRNKTHCPHGHPYDEKNTGPAYGSTRRRCRACARAYQARKTAERKAAA